MAVDFDALRARSRGGRRAARAAPTRRTSPARAAPTCASTSPAARASPTTATSPRRARSATCPCGEGFIAPAGGEGTVATRSLASIGLVQGQPGAPDVEGGHLTQATGPAGERLSSCSPAPARRHEPRRARRRHQRAREADRQHPRGREDPRHRPRRVRRQRRHRRHRLGAGPPRRRRARPDADDRRHAGARRRALRALSVLLAVPNVSEGRDAADARRDRRTRSPPAARACSTSTPTPTTTARLHARRRAGHAARRRSLAGARAAVERIDLARHDGRAPARRRARRRAGRLLDAAAARRGAAPRRSRWPTRSRELGLPVFLYGELAGGRTRAELRRGGPAGLAQRMADGLRARLRPRAPAPDRRRDARRRAPAAGRLQRRARAARDRRRRARRSPRAIREGGAAGLPGVRALGLKLAARGDVARSRSTSRTTRRVPLARRGRGGRAPRARRREAELVGLAPRGRASTGFPDRRRRSATEPTHRGAL